MSPIYTDVTVQHDGEPVHAVAAARSYDDERQATAAFERLLAKAGDGIDASWYRHARLSESADMHLVTVIGERAAVRRIFERVAVGGRDITLTNEEATAMLKRRVVQLQESGDSTIRRGPNSHVRITPDGRIQPVNRPQG